MDEEQLTGADVRQVGQEQQVSAGPAAESPLDRRPGPDGGDARAELRVTVERAAAERLTALAAECGGSPLAVTAAVVRVLLARLSGQADVALGVMAGGPTSRQVVRRTVDGDRTLRELVHAEVSALASTDGPAADQGAEHHLVLDVAVRQDPSGAHGAPGDLAIAVGRPRPDGTLEISASYRTDVLQERAVRRVLDHLGLLLASLAADPDQPVRAYRSLPPEQHAELLALGSGGDSGFAADGNLLALVEAQAARHPQAPAVRCGEQTLTYAELDAAAEALARRIAAAGPLGPDRVVAFACVRSEMMVVTLLAILKTGSAFLPLDPEQPDHRLAGLIRDSGAVVVVTDGIPGNALAETGVPVVAARTSSTAQGDAPAFPAAGPRDLAYVVYTSGSTGTPKGVMVEHRGIVNTVLFRIGYYGLGPDSRVLQVDPLHADAGISDVFTALAAGAPLVVITRDQLLDPDEVAAVIQREGITHAQMVPSLYQLLLDYAGPALRSVRQVVLGGERITEALAARHARLLPGSDLFNEYGPSEDSVLSTLHRLVPGEETVPIGRPLPDRWADVLDEDGRLVPLGAPGELCVGGVGLARGYLGSPELTARRFVAHPERDGARMYRTGDLARWLPDGTLCYLGRIDDQVKIRGNRVEPGETAAVLELAPEVRACAVVAAPGASGEPRLVAYVVGGAAHSDLRAFAAERLPAFMVPEAFVTVDALPLSPSGKLDRRALPDAPVFDAPASDAPAVDATWTETEQRVARLWSELLGKPVTELDADLFSLGGHSLVAARIAQELGVAVKTVFARPTVRAVARAVADDAVRTPRRPSEPAVPVVEVGQGAGPGAGAAGPLSRAQRRVWLTSRRQTPGAFIISDLVHTGRSIDADALRTALDAVVARQSMLRACVRSQGASAELVVLDHLPDGPPLSVVALPDADPRGPR
ncbi:amino acid adenylation domain-containing protein [Streptomyces sp. TLI_146]|nr:amino acid adenylation domain-containing protein [Streptomyces sp. TLI_146]